MRTRDILRMAASVVLCGVLVAAPATAGQHAASATSSSPAAYVSVQPCRLADTRLSSGYTRIDALTLQIAARGVCGVPTSATALALTLTVVGPQGTGYLTAWPADEALPTVSNLNFSQGQIRANGAIIRIDGSGQFRVFTSVATQVVIDVVGAFVPATSSAAGRFVAQPSTRVFDSRAGAKLAPGSSVTVPLPASVPSDAVALALNVTVTESSGPGFVTEFPAGRAMPTSSILNVDQANQTRAAAGIFPVSSSGVALYLSGGGHIVVDLLGYFTGPSAGQGTDGLFTAIDPTRVLDTRGASPLGNGTPLYPGGGLELPLTQGGAVAYNVTSVDGGPGYISAFPAGTVQPGTSTLNAVGGGEIVANFAITQVSNRGLGVYSQPQTQLLVDVQGWFSGPTATATQPPPTNSPPANVTFSACTSDGLSSINSTRQAAGVASLAPNAKAQAFACSYAMQLAVAHNGLIHSAEADRDAAVGCPTGENIALSSGTSWTSLMSLWYGSPPHMANIKNTIYRSAALGFVIRTDAAGNQSIYGDTVFAVC